MVLTIFLSSEEGVSRIESIHSNSSLGDVRF